MHGNGKTDADIDAALAAGCGLVVLDGPDEGARVAAAAERHGRRQPVAVRVTPGIVAGGHEKIATAHEGSKFGLAPADAARACLEAREDPPARLARACTCTSARRWTIPACSRASCAGSASSATSTRSSRA